MRREAAAAASRIAPVLVSQLADPAPPGPALLPPLHLLAAILVAVPTSLRQHVAALEQALVAIVRCGSESASATGAVLAAGQCLGLFPRCQVRPGWGFMGLIVFKAWGCFLAVK